MCPNNKGHQIRKLRRPKNGRIVEPPTPNSKASKSETDTEVVISSDDEESGDVILDVPIHNFDDTPTGFSAPIPKERYKQIDDNGVVYRLSSKGIKLDFIQAVYEMRGDTFPDTCNSEILLSLDEIASRGTSCNSGNILVANQSPQEPSQSLEPSQPQEPSQPSHSGETNKLPSVSRSGIEMLLESALSLTAPKSLKDSTKSLEASQKRNGRTRSSTPPFKASQTTSAHPHNLRDISIARNVKSRHSSPYESNGKTGGHQNDALKEEGIIRPEERTHLIAIKRLMELKGKEALMEFLLHSEAEK